MKFEIKVKVGKQEILISDEVKNAVEFFEKVSFFTSLPETGPNGETDLEFRHRVTKDGHNYYSIVSGSGNVELTLGQSKKVPGQLYTKEWKAVHEAFVKEESSNPIQPVVNAPKQAVNPKITEQKTPLPKNSAPIKAPTPLKKAPIPKTTKTTQEPTKTTNVPKVDVNNIIEKYTA